MVNNIDKEKKVSVILPNKTKIMGIVSKIPTIVERHDKFSNIIRNEKNKVILIISLLEALPEKYSIHGLPVKVFL